MIKHLYIIASLMLFLFVGCTKEEDVDGDYKYVKTDTVSVLSHKEDYFYPGTSIRSKNKGYVIVDKDMRKSVVSHIDGFDSIYEEGHEYLIIVKIYGPRYEMQDLYGYRYKFVDDVISTVSTANTINSYNRCYISIIRFSK